MTFVAAIPEQIVTTTMQSFKVPGELCYFEVTLLFPHLHYMRY